jgi:hypothetical protein
MNVIQNNDARRVVHGVEYHAVTARNGLCRSTAAYCTLYSDPRREVGCKDLPCHKHLRKDRTDVIWVKAVP